MARQREFSKFERGIRLDARRLGYPISETVSTLEISRCHMHRGYFTGSITTDHCEKRSGRSGSLNNLGRTHLLRIVCGNTKATMAQIVFNEGGTK